MDSQFGISGIIIHIIISQYYLIKLNIPNSFFYCILQIRFIKMVFTTNFEFEAEMELITQEHMAQQGTVYPVNAATVT